MPFYEYACQACGHEMAKLQKMSDIPLTDCEQCGQSTLIKQISLPSFRLKGKGWYETDFKPGNKKNLAQCDSSESACSGCPAAGAH